jgi:methyl-accepting chemotaxis protein
VSIGLGGVPVIKQFDNVAIGAKLTVAFVSLLGGFATVWIVVLFNLHNIQETSRLSDQSHEIITMVESAVGTVNQQSASALGYQVSPSAGRLKTYDAAGKAFDQSTAALKAAVQSPDQIDRLNVFIGGVDSWRRDVAEPQIRLAGDPATRDQALAMINSGLGLIKVKAIRAAASALESAERTKLAERSAAQAGAIAFTTTALLAGGALTVVLSLLMQTLLSRSIGKSVVAMTSAMDRLAAGDQNVEVPAVGRKDEVGRMAGAVQTFKAAAIEKTRLEAEALETRRRADAESARNEQEKADANRRQTDAMEALASGLEKLSEGNVVFRLKTAFAPEYEKLRLDFNGAVNKLQETMTIVVANADAIRSGAGEIAHASDDLSRRTEHQAASLEETAAALDEITATVRKTAQGAVRAREVVSSAQSDAERSGSVIRQTVAAMSSIEQSSNQISQIIGVIDEIAFQTNLLALNAGVEAARAGESGRGFAVVASEVRALAQRSADAAKEIKGLISASAQHVASGVNLVDETGHVLETILAQVTEINVIVADIAASAQEQAVALDQVNSAVNQMDQVTQQNAAMVEQTTAASHSLSEEAQELSTLMGRFEVGRDQQPATAPVRHASKAHSPIPAMKTVGHGGAARKPVAAHDTGSWEEF